jgi:recombination protein RecR
MKERGSSRDAGSSPRQAGGRRLPSVAYPPAVQRLIDEFEKLPGVGRRSAERFAFHVLRSPREEALALSGSIRDVLDEVRRCSVCCTIAGSDPCAICADPARDAGCVLVVEQPRDLAAIEQAGAHRGVYHVLMGHISPLDGIGAEQLTIAELEVRVRDPAHNRGHRVREVVLGLNPSLEGDGTAMHIAEGLKGTGVRVTRLARGLPTGGQLEMVSRAVLADAVEGRRPVEEQT